MGKVNKTREQTLSIGNRLIPVAFKRRGIAQNIQLSMGSRGILRVSMPWLMSQKKAWDMIMQNIPWIESQLKKHPCPTLLSTLENIDILGESHRIVYQYPMKAVVCRDNGILYIKNTQGKTKGENIEKALRALARMVITESVHHHAHIMGQKVQAVHIRDSKTRWGVCSSLGNIGISWRLLLAPHHVLEYVVIHEVAHRQHMNHGKEFWAFVEKYCSTMTESKAWLKTYGHQLHGYKP